MAAEPVEEYAVLYSGGSMLVRPDDPEIDRIYPRPLWIEHQQRHGGHVYRRTVIVVDDWEEVPSGREGNGRPNDPHRPQD